MAPCEADRVIYSNAVSATDVINIKSDMMICKVSWNLSRNVLLPDLSISSFTNQPLTQCFYIILAINSAGKQITNKQINYIMITVFCDVTHLSSRRCLTTFRKNLQLPSSTLKMEAAIYSKTLVNIYQINSLTSQNTVIFIFTGM